MSKLAEWLQIFKLAWHIHKNLPPRDGKYHAVSFNIKLVAPKKEVEDV